MRTKGGLESEYIDQGDWKDKNVRGQRYSTLEVEMVDGKRKVNVHSFSGNERNKMFLNSSGGSFEDASILSGVDSPADGRSFSIWDFDKDGAQDIVLINSNEPHIQVFRNQLPAAPSNNHAFVAVRLVGGNDKPEGSSEWSNRNGIGAKILVKTDNDSILRELRCGEGFAAQNSQTLIIGIGNHDQSEVIEIKWPSGKKQEIESVQAGSLITVFENPTMSSNETPFEVEVYEKTNFINQTTKLTEGLFNFDLEELHRDDSNIKVMITMATWCASCKKQIQPISRLKQALARSGVSFYGVPVDKSDTKEMLKKYSDVNDVPYRILVELADADRDLVATHMNDYLGSDALPCTLITDQLGNPLHIQFGIPTISDIRRLQSKVDRRR